MSFELIPSPGDAENVAILEEVHSSWTSGIVTLGWIGGHQSRRRHSLARSGNVTCGDETSP